jgi:hypothetical protein
MAGLFGQDRTTDRDEQVVVDFIDDSIAFGAITVGTTAVACRIGASILTGRKAISINNRGPRSVYYGGSGVTIASGTEVSRGEKAFLPIGNVEIYLISDVAGQDVRVIEYA